MGPKKKISIFLFCLSPPSKQVRNLLGDSLCAQSGRRCPGWRPAFFESDLLQSPQTRRVAQTRRSLMADLMLTPFGDPALSADDLLARLAWLRDVIRPRLERCVGYYRNPTTELAGVLPCSAKTSFAVRPFRQYQELGLPARITGFRRSADGCAVPTGRIDSERKEVVIENDIAWRMNTLVDFTAGRMPAVTSAATDEPTRARLNPIITAILESGGG